MWCDGAMPGGGGGAATAGSRSNVTDAEAWLPPLIELVRQAYARGKRLVGEHSNPADRGHSCDEG